MVGGCECTRQSTAGLVLKITLTMPACPCVHCPLPFYFPFHFISFLRSPLLLISIFFSFFNNQPSVFLLFSFFPFSVLFSLSSLLLFPFTSPFHFSPMDPHRVEEQPVQPQVGGDKV